MRSDQLRNQGAALWVQVRAADGLRFAPTLYPGRRDSVRTASSAGFRFIEGADSHIADQLALRGGGFCSALGSSALVMTCSVVAKQTIVQRCSALTRYVALGYNPTTTVT